jgi:hypothetical protein
VAAVTDGAYAAEPTLAVAQLLATAETAAQGTARDRPGLAGTLAALDGLGARPADAATDPMKGWRALLTGPAAPPMRGRVLGPAYQRGMLEAGASVTLDQLFDGGRQARVAVATAGAAPIGIAVLDGAGRPVCSKNLARAGQCNWVPPFSARHQIVISNPGPARSAYYLVID